VPKATPLWIPSPDQLTSAQLTRWIDDFGGSYEALHAWSIAEPGAFWSTVWERFGVVGQKGNSATNSVEPTVYAVSTTSATSAASALSRATTVSPVSPVSTAFYDLRDTLFFPQATLSYAENLLHGRGVDEHTEAVVTINELGVRVAHTWAGLRAEVAATAAAFRAEGLRVGDRVAIWLPAGIHALVLLLAANAIGAISSSVSPDFGEVGALDRFGQIEPALLVGCSSYQYGGKTFDIGERITAVATALPSLRRVVMTADWDTWLAPHRNAKLSFEQLPFDHPLYVLYSSGTTGKPKCITHGAGRILLKHLSEHGLHSNVGPGDRVTWFTTTGWMMWNWIVSALSVGATVVLYDGNPAYPTIGRLFDLVDDEALTMLGVSAKFIDSVAKANYHPAEHHDLGSLRTLGSTGSPLSPEGFTFAYEHIKSDVHVASIAGGTDICGCFVGGDPTSPVYAGEIQRAVLGMDVHAWDASGNDTPVGAAGELVCLSPFPTIPVGFWGDDTAVDPHGARFSSAYFATYPGIWHHGDFVSVTEHGGFVIHGRSDTTLNPGGVRIGTAEIYRIVEQIPGIIESLVFGQDFDRDSRVILLVRLGDGVELDDDLRADIRARIRTGCTPRHVPAVIIVVNDLPRTRSNKLVELAVADAVNGRPVRNTEGLANPEALWAIASLDELRN
jgi:acetoacetyl-CoA synthetase